MCASVVLSIIRVLVAQGRREQKEEEEKDEESDLYCQKLPHPIDTRIPMDAYTHRLSSNKYYPDSIMCTYTNARSHTHTHGLQREEKKSREKN